MKAATEGPFGKLLPAGWTVIENGRNSEDQLATLCTNMAMARAGSEEALQDLASRHGIKSSRVASAMQMYADALLNAVVGDLKRQLAKVP
jgi:hypothetical protein